MDYEEWKKMYITHSGKKKEDLYVALWRATEISNTLIEGLSKNQKETTKWKAAFFFTIGIGLIIWSVF